jgi:hypothetical protein
MKKNILIIICKYLSTNDILHLNFTNKFNNNIISNSEDVWNNITLLKKKVNLSLISKYTKSINKLDLRYCSVVLDLNKFDFRNLNYIDVYGTKNIIKILPKLFISSKNIKHLNLKWQNITCNMLYIISLNLVNTLTYLNIAKKRMGPFNQISSSSGIHNLINLKYLNLRNNFITSTYLIKLLFNLEFLEEFNLPYDISTYQMCICKHSNITLDKIVENLKRKKKILLRPNTFCKSITDILNYHCKDILVYN